MDMIVNKTIRKSVFETNSSSSHSITIDSSGKLDTITPNRDGIITIEGGDFGWGYEVHNDAYTKASYAYQGEISKERLRKVIMEHTGATKVKFRGRKSGYIDHQSFDLASEELYTDELLRDFIFGSNSELCIDNDNH